MKFCCYSLISWKEERNNTSNRFGNRIPVSLFFEYPVTSSFVSFLFILIELSIVALTKPFFLLTDFIKMNILIVKVDSCLISNAR